MHCATACNLINCPSVTLLDATTFETCVLFEALRPLNECDYPPTETGMVEYFINYGEIIYGDRPPVFSLNATTFANPKPAVNSLLQGDVITNYCVSGQKCGYKGGECNCYNELSFPFGKTVQLVIMNMGAYDAHWIHPIHIHGHSFYLMKMTYNEANDIDCTADVYCNNGAKWKNKPKFSQHPIRKDTVIVPKGGYFVVRLRADNPGKWIMHCHIDDHANQGMAIILSEQPTKYYAADTSTVCKDYTPQT